MGHNAHVVHETDKHQYPNGPYQRVANGSNESNPWIGHIGRVHVPGRPDITHMEVQIKKQWQAGTFDVNIDGALISYCQGSRA